MNINSAHNIFFVGIGGIGMSALARYFHLEGKTVAGYDKTQTAITDDLIKMGIKTTFNETVESVPKAYLDKDNTLVIYTPAVPQNQEQLRYFTEHGFTVLKRSQVLGKLTENSFCFAVAGTHGKTTTTAILGHLLNECSVKLTAFLGGISENYDSNLIYNGTDVTVVEADEFDRSFLTLSPNSACITSMDADHLDIYGDEADLKATFKAFANQVKPNGKLFVKNGLDISGISFGIEDDSTYEIQDIKVKGGSYAFHIKTPKSILKDVALNLPGRHNLMNALVAFAMAFEYGCNAEQLVNALANFKGVKRRFSYKIKTKDLVFIDDYAHHPEEINAVHQAVTELYPDKRNLVVFQPHLFSRTRDFADAFAQSLSQFDEVVLLDIYPARELPIEGITSAWLLDKIDNPNKALVEKKDITKKLNESSAEVVLTLGAGDIGKEVEHIKQALQVEG